MKKPIARQLALDLRKIVAQLDAAGDSGPEGEHYVSGICFAVSRLRTGEENRHLAYEEVNEVLYMVQEGWNELGGRLGGSGQSDTWKMERPLMCLFMAEWLESEVLS